MPYLDKTKAVLAARRLKDRSRAAGACVRCGKTRPAQKSRFQLNLGEPCWTCGPCSRKHAATLRERHKSNLAAGKCGQCGKNPLETQTLCHDCRERVKEYAREIRLYLISVGRCTSCRKVNDSHTTRCCECNEKHKRSKRRSGSNDPSSATRPTRTLRTIRDTPIGEMEVGSPWECPKWLFEQVYFPLDGRPKKEKENGKRK